MSDPRTAVEYRLPAIDLKPGDLVNTSPGEDDWQQVVGVYRKAGDAKSNEIRSLVESLGGRYVVVQLTDLAPVDGITTTLCPFPLDRGPLFGGATLVG